MLSSNDYLGLTHHPKVKEAGKKAIEQMGQVLLELDWRTVVEFFILNWRKN